MHGAPRLIRLVLQLQVGRTTFGDVFTGGGAFTDAHCFVCQKYTWQPTPPLTPPRTPPPPKPPTPQPAPSCTHRTYTSGFNGRCYDPTWKECRKSGTTDPLAPLTGKCAGSTDGAMCCPGGNLVHFATQKATPPPPGPTLNPPGPTPNPPGPTPSPVSTPPATPPPANIPPPPPACAQGVKFIDAPNSHKHLRSVTFRVMPQGQWGSARGCSNAGYDRVCPVYLSTRTYPNPSKGQLYLSLWKDAEAGRNQGSWVITWAIAKNRPIDQGNFKTPPYGVLAASTATREFEVDKAPGWPGGTTLHCLDTGPGPTPPPSLDPNPTPFPGPGPTPPSSPPRFTPPIITTTTTIPMWTTRKSTATKQKPPSPASTHAPDFQCPLCTQGLGPCAQRVTSTIVICSRYTDDVAKTCKGATTDCTTPDPTASPPTPPTTQPQITPPPPTPPNTPPPTLPRTTSTTTITYWTGVTRTSTVRQSGRTLDAASTTTTALPPNEGACL